MVALKHSAMLVTVFALASASGLCRLKTDTAQRREFEVASIKPSNPNADGGGIKPLPGGQSYIATNAPVKLMIKLMFHLNDRQISGGPGWIETDCTMSKPKRMAHTQSMSCTSCFKIC